MIVMNVMSTDVSTKKNIKMTIKGLESMLSDRWDDGVPLEISHDTHKVIGWVLPSCIYIKPKLTRLMGLILIADDDGEQEIIDNLVQNYFHEHHKCNEDSITLKKLISTNLSGKERCFHNECASILDEGIAKKVFPKLFEDIDDEGLISLDLILKYFKPLDNANGVFKSKECDLVVFAHPYFRRSFSRFNNYYSYLLPKIIALKDQNVGIALDEDLVGYSTKFNEPIELDYWRGPIFNNDIKQISPGVSIYTANDHEKFFYGISKI